MIAKVKAVVMMVVAWVKANKYAFIAGAVVGFAVRGCI